MSLFSSTIDPPNAGKANYPAAAEMSRFARSISDFQALREECKRTVCDCELVYVVGRAGKLTQKQVIAFTSVNCSHRGLTEMPGFLPANTTTLRLTGNKVLPLNDANFVNDSG